MTRQEAQTWRSELMKEKPKKDYEQWKKDVDKCNAVIVKTNPQQYAR